MQSIEQEDGMATTKTGTRLAFLSSTRELPGGGHEREIPAGRVWTEARKLGLTEADYGSWWFVYESKQDYLDSLD